MTLRNHTMRDLLSKLDAIISETALKDKDDLSAKRQALDDLESDPVAGKDPEISAAIDQRRSDLEREAKAKGFSESFQIGDAFGISFSEDHEIATEIVDILEDGIVIELDDTALDMLANEGLVFLDGEIVREEKQKGVDGKACWKGYRRMGTKMKGGKRVDNCVKVSEGFGSMEERVAYLLKRFDSDMNAIGGYGDPDMKEIIQHLKNGDAESAAEVVWYAYTDQDGGEFPEKEDYVDDLQAEFEELVDGGDQDTNEGKMSEIDIDLQSLANRGDEEDLIAALEGDMGPGTADVLQNMMDELKDELASKGMNDVINDDDKMVEMLWDKIVDEYGGRDDSDEGGETDDNYALASAGFGSDEDYGDYGNNESQEERTHKGGTVIRTDKGLKHYAKYDDDQDDNDFDDNKINKSMIYKIEKSTKPDRDVDEAKYQGKEVPLGKKLPGDVKKSKVYVRKPNGKVVKVNFGDKKMRIKKSNPARRKSFRARHNCKNPGPRWKARYWSCRSW